MFKHYNKKRVNFMLSLMKYRLILLLIGNFIIPSTNNQIKQLKTKKCTTLKIVLKTLLRDALLFTVMCYFESGGDDIKKIL